MKSFSTWVDRFCAKHRNFGVQNLMLYIVVGNLLVWVFTMMDKSYTLLNMLYFNAEAIFTQGQIWRLFTFALIPQGTDIFMFIALYFYYMIGSTLERYWGTGKFTIYYISGIVFNILYGTIFWLLGYNVFVSAFYLNMSMFFTFAMLYPDMTVLLMFVIPIKIKWLAILDVALFAWAVVTGTFPTNLLPIVAILNFLIFCWDDIMHLAKRNGYARSKSTINFKKEAARVNREQRNKPYTRKCEVCGKTDTDNPNLEFRYCSRCSGYHCYCEEHINNHAHHKD